MTVVRAALAILATVVVGAPAALASPLDGGPPGRADRVADQDRAFAQALSGLAGPDDDETAQRLERTARRYPENRQAADALYTAATLREERLSQPGLALALYQELVARYPDHRTARAAERRMATLSRLLGPAGDGAAAHAVFEDLRERSSGRPDAAVVRDAEQLLAAHPHWAGAYDVGMWLGEMELRQGHYGAAHGRFRAAAERASTARDRMSALLGAAEAATRSGAFDAADALLAAIALDDDPASRSIVSEARSEVASARRRARAARWAAWTLAAALLALALLLLLAARGARPALSLLWPPPLEALYLAPVAAVLFAIATTGYQGLATAVGWVSAGGVAIAWLSGAGLEQRRRATQGYRRWVAVHIVVVMVAVLALTVVAVWHAGLIEPILETLAHGPDR